MLITTGVHSNLWTNGDGGSPGQSVPFNSSQNCYSSNHSIPSNSKLFSVSSSDSGRHARRRRCKPRKLPTSCDRPPHLNSPPKPPVNNTSSPHVNHQPNLPFSQHIFPSVSNSYPPLQSPLPFQFPFAQPFYPSNYPQPPLNPYYSQPLVPPYYSMPHVNFPVFPTSFATPSAPVPINFGVATDIVNWELHASAKSHTTYANL
ncbi:hypothetical protein AGABI1DRAFT_133241 [Agaricus bisporus var. burnettii JB137-S8]|uniref:Uncharacterized protein n=1 Tax=Agaricus bisporus var. burnettii (strain JB137-S8 / ATCC MYA-4627 / FGSC 10392) TaxID=597362 RepID=K5WV47_AGABU|nr:uncharacterized protein AGABI1DRAFT_133241 [Agaricus bisporus var. burnettii JB137-S8]EKM74452.1 hypothetical protein AGABI1DRAFT_133241 [Agaricus bisporus var. burnettii JB137-S8]